MLTPFQIGFYMQLAGLSYEGSCPWPWDRFSYLNPNACYETNFHAQWGDGCSAAYDVSNTGPDTLS